MRSSFLVRCPDISSIRSPGKPRKLAQILKSPPARRAPYIRDQSLIKIYHCISCTGNFADWISIKEHWLAFNVADPRAILFLIIKRFDIDTLDTTRNITHWDVGI